MLASEILRSMKTKVERARAVIVILTALLILENLFFLFH